MYLSLLYLHSLGMWSRAIEGFSESRVSVRRVRDFLLLPEAPKRNWGSTTASTTASNTTTAGGTTTSAGDAASTTATTATAAGAAGAAGDAATAGATAAGVTAGHSDGSSVLSNGAVSNGAVDGDSTADHAVQQQQQLQPLLSIKDAAFSWHALTEAYAKSTAAALAPTPPVVADETQQNGAAPEQQHEQQQQQQPTVSNVTFDAHRGKLVSSSCYSLLTCLITRQRSALAYLLSCTSWCRTYATMNCAVDLAVCACNLVLKTLTHCSSARMSLVVLIVHSCYSCTLNINAATAAATVTAATAATATR
jgi:hypothetical protein